ERVVVFFKLVSKTDVENVTGTRQRNFLLKRNHRRSARTNNDAIGKCHRFHEVMRDENHRLLVFCGKLQKQTMHRELELSIERCEWLVQQRRFGALDDHTGQTHPLCPSPGQFIWKARLKPVEPDYFYDIFRAGLA